VTITASSGTPITVLFSDPELRQQCWQAGGAALPAAEPLRSLEWLVATNALAPTPFDFCIEKLSAVVE